MANVLKQASLEATCNARLRNKMKDHKGIVVDVQVILLLLKLSLICLLTGEDVLTTLIFMVYLFPEARAKPDSNRVIYFTKV